MTMLERRKKAAAERAARKPDAGLLEAAARRLADWRLSGCPGYDFHKEIRAEVERIAKAAGLSYSEVWAEVHRKAYDIIGADPRAQVKSQG